MNPDSYRAFLKTGHWPDKTMFVLEVRNSASHASIDHDGHFQTSKIGVEAEVKDSSTKSGEWTFYGFGTPAPILPTLPPGPIPRSADCYSCHAANTAVGIPSSSSIPDLFAVAIAKGTLNPQLPDLRFPLNPMLILSAASPTDPRGSPATWMVQQGRHG